MSIITQISYAVDWGEDLTINGKIYTNRECKKLLDIYTSLDKEGKEIFKQLDNRSDNYTVILTLELISKINDHFDKKAKLKEN